MTTTPQFDPIELCDLIAGARKRITITPSDNGSVRFKTARFYSKADGRPPQEITVDYDPVGLAAALSKIPGFTATYEVPVVVPTGLGAVVEHEGNMYVRVDVDGEPWRESDDAFSSRSRSGDWLWHSDAQVAVWLRDGAVVRSEGVAL